MPISAKSSIAARPPTTSVAVRQGNVLGSGSACCTARSDSPRGASLLHRPGPRRRETLVEGSLRPPAELARRVRDVEHAPLQLAEARLREPRLLRDPARRLNRVV